MMRFHGFIQDGVMPRKQRRHLLRMFLCEPGAAFDVGEEKGDGTGRELIRISHLQH